MRKKPLPKSTMYSTRQDQSLPESKKRLARGKKQLLSLKLFTWKPGAIPMDIVIENIRYGNYEILAREEARTKMFVLEYWQEKRTSLL